MRQVTSPTPAKPTPLTRKFWLRASWALVLSVAGHLLAAGAYDCIHLHVKSPPTAETGLAAVQAVLLVIAGFAVFWICGLSGQRSRLHLTPVLWMVIGAIFGGHWVGLGLHELIHDLPAPLIMLLALVFIVPAIWALHDLAEEEDAVRLLELYPRRASKEPARFRALILCVSKPDFVPQMVKDDAVFIAQIGPDPKNPVVKLTGVIGEDLKLLRSAPSGFDWNWEQILQALQPHTKLETICLIGSRSRNPNARPKDAGTPDERDGSDIYLPRCEELLRAYFAKRRQTVNFLHALKAVPFEDFVQLRDCIRDQVRALTARLPTPDSSRFLQGLSRFLESVGLEFGKRRRLDPGGVVVDVTGGFKVTSIAGAVVTLRRECVCQYVPTEDVPSSGRDPLIYDFRESPGAGHA